MKKGEKYTFGEVPLSRRQLRVIEKELGVYIDVPQYPDEDARGQRFGIYDEDESYVEEVGSAGTYFIEEELRGAIRNLFSK